MKSLLTVICICALLGSSFAMVDLSEFLETIYRPCIERQWTPQYPNDGTRPFESSMESFIAMVENIERNHTDWSIYDISKTLIKRFGFDGVTIEPFDGALKASIGDKHADLRTEIIDKLVVLKTSEINRLDDRDLTTAERCTMYFMLGHNVNSTFREGIDEIILAEQRGSHDKDSSPPQQKRAEAKRPREQGVVSLFGDGYHAIALGKVLMGIIASEREYKPMIRDIVPDFAKAYDDFPGEKVLESLIGVTVGDAVAHAVISKHHSDNVIGNGGDWNTTLGCATDYQLKAKTHGLTVAQARGAVDGYLIGLYLRRNSNGGRVTLSKTLRMYYDPRGLPGDSPSDTTTYCRRREFVDKEGQSTLVDSITAFYNIYFAKESKQVDNEAHKRCADAFSTFQNLISQQVDDERCRPLPIEKRCESSANLFVIMDDSERDTNGFVFQRETIRHLTSHLDIGSGASTVGVYFNSRDSGANLRPIVYNETNEGRISCIVSWLKPNDMPQPVDEEGLLHAINGTLQDFELRTAEEDFAPAKVVVIFKSGSLKLEDRNRITAASTRLRHGHRDTRIIAIGDNQEALQLLATDPKDVLTGYRTSADLAKKLAEYVCEVPSVLQHEECFNRQTREGQVQHTGFVTPEHIQYIAMYPQYFHRSHNPTFKFSVEGSTGDITVCFSRTVVNPTENNLGNNQNRNEPLCLNTGSTNRELIFRMSNPCHRYNVNNCNPAYFSISGKTGSQRGARCLDAGCRRTDQIKYSVSVSDVYCSSFQVLSASPYALLLVLATAIYRMLKN